MILCSSGFRCGRDQCFSWGKKVSLSFWTLLYVSICLQLSSPFTSSPIQLSPPETWGQAVFWASNPAASDRRLCPEERQEVWTCACSHLRVIELYSCVSQECFFDAEKQKLHRCLWINNEGKRKEGEQMLWWQRTRGFPPLWGPGRVSVPADITRSQQFIKTSLGESLNTWCSTFSGSKMSEGNKSYRIVKVTTVIILSTSSHQHRSGAGLSDPVSR